MRIREKRLATGLTQVQLAQKLGIGQKAVSQWESGITCPSIRLLPVLARIFGCRIDDLFEEMDGYTPEVPAQGGARVEDPGPEAPAREPGPDEDVSIDDLFEL